MPSIFTSGGYVVYFWSNENNEPIHVHISKGAPTANATKIWILEKGGCIVANNNGRIPSKDLNVLMELISAHYFVICTKWKEFFNVETIKYYC